MSPRSREHGTLRLRRGGLAPPCTPVPPPPALRPQRDDVGITGRAAPSPCTPVPFLRGAGELISDRKSHHNFDELLLEIELFPCHRHLERSMFIEKYIFIENITEPAIENLWQYFGE